MKKKELTQEEMDFILGGEIQEFSVAGPTDYENNNRTYFCICEYNDHRSSANNNEAERCTCTCT